MQQSKMKIIKKRINISQNKRQKKKVEKLTNEVRKAVFIVKNIRRQKIRKYFMKKRQRLRLGQKAAGTEMVSVYSWQRQ